jgi:altronate dehydratase large subunit
MGTFLGYERGDGSVGIRNHVAVIPSVSCANGVVEAISRQVPGVVPLYHSNGCGRGGSDLLGHSTALQNLCKNPNIAAALVVGLGCEVVNAEGMAMASAFGGRTMERIMIQEEGGSQKTAAKGVEIVHKFIEDVKKLRARPFPMDNLIIGLECGGSDAFSGVTANPAVGVAVDWIVDNGGTVILTETTEMIGTSHILERRAINKEVAGKIAEIIDNTIKKTEEVLGPFAKIAISPGNMDGGMSCIREKSLGCIAKAGSRKVSEVIDYALAPKGKGLVIMHGPGYDTESMTGLAAAGAQVIVFTTGMGSPIGFPIVPVIKVASTSKTFRAMEDDMDINAGEILEGRTLQDLGTDIRDRIIGVINGDNTKAEINRQNGIICIYTQTTSF